MPFKDGFIAATSWTMSDLLGISLVGHWGFVGHYQPCAGALGTPSVSLKVASVWWTVWQPIPPPPLYSTGFSIRASFYRPLLSMGKKFLCITDRAATYNQSQNIGIVNCCGPHRRPPPRKPYRIDCQFQVRFLVRLLLQASPAQVVHKLASPR